MRYLCTLLLPLLLLAATACSSVGHHEAGIDNFDQVSPTVYRGAQPTLQGMRTLAKYHVQTIINLRDDDDSREARMASDAGMTYIHLPLDAETVTPADADRFLTLLSTAPAPVFVHCMVGRDRTGLAIAAYRLRVQGWNQDAALCDLNAHGHFWLFFPKVRAAIVSLANAAPAPSQGHDQVSSVQPAPAMPTGF